MVTFFTPYAILMQLGNSKELDGSAKIDGLS